MAGLAVVVISTVVGSEAAAPTAAAADTSVNVGMPITIGTHQCTLGFFGYNARDNHLAVTAGHCSDQVANQPVYISGGVQIGEVIAWKADEEDGPDQLTGSRGYTVFTVYQQFSVNPFFTAVGGALTHGDTVSKMGERTGESTGTIIKVKSVRGRPDFALLWSDMTQLPGDSGGPWYTPGPTIVGLSSSTDGVGSQAQPIGAVIDMIRANPTVWGNDFKVWLVQ
jgi:hypothetical protein